MLAAQGTLELAPIVVAGALGAIAGDSAVYWIARRGTGGLKQRLQRPMTGERVGKAIEFLERRGPMVIVVGRFVPGVRLVVNFTLGVREYPYKRFLLRAARIQEGSELSAQPALDGGLPGSSPG